MIDTYKDPLYVNLISAHFQLVILPYWACASGLGADDWYGRIVSRPVNQLAHELDLPRLNHGFLHSDYELISEENIDVYIQKSDFYHARSILEQRAKDNLRPIK